MRHHLCQSQNPKSEEDPALRRPTLKIGPLAGDSADTGGMRPENSRISAGLRLLPNIVANWLTERVIIIYITRMIIKDLIVDDSLNGD
jgi:hypothetical protein